MATVPPTARVVVIGAGIVGNSLVHHLARLGWRDIVQIDKGPLPNPGGSTGHASNFIFPVDHSREITDLTLDSVRQYKEMGVFTESGGFEIARTPERMEELRRRMSSAKAWGIEAELVSPAFVKEKVPFIEEDQFVGAFWTPSVGVVDSLRATSMPPQRIGTSSSAYWRIESSVSWVISLEWSTGKMKLEACPVDPPGSGSGPFSSSRMSRQPWSARWRTTELPTIPAPTTTMSARSGRSPMMAPRHVSTMLIC